MNGFELLQQVRLLYPAMPVILMSAFWDASRRVKARACTAQATLEKPVTADQLIELFGGRRETHYERAAAPAPVLSVV